MLLNVDVYYSLNCKIMNKYARTHMDLCMLIVRRLPNCAPWAGRRELCFQVRGIGWTLRCVSLNMCKCVPAEPSNLWKFRLNHRHTTAASSWVACISPMCAQSLSAALECYSQWSWGSLQKSLQCLCSHWTGKWLENEAVRWTWNKV